MIEYLFTVPGNPRGKQRPRATRQGRMYTPKETVIYENLIKHEFISKYPETEPTERPLILKICADYPIPESWSKSKKIDAIEMRIFPKKPDWDNVGKVVSDALNGIAYVDDSQVFYSNVLKRYSTRPRLTVLIEVLEDGETLTDERN